MRGDRHMDKEMWPRNKTSKCIPQLHIMMLYLDAIVNLTD
jgi:hypothetical protein